MGNLQKMNSEQRERLNRLFDLANRRQNVEGWEKWSNITKSALSYVLHGYESLRDCIELELQKEGI